MDDYFSKRHYDFFKFLSLYVVIIMFYLYNMNIFFHNSFFRWIIFFILVLNIKMSENNRTIDLTCEDNQIVHLTNENNQVVHLANENYQVIIENGTNEQTVYLNGDTEEYNNEYSVELDYFNGTEAAASSTSSGSGPSNIIVNNNTSTAWIFFDKLTNGQPQCKSCKKLF